MMNNKLNDNELEMVTGGTYDTITDAMRRLANRLVYRANRDLYGKDCDLDEGSPLNSEQLTYWNDRFRYYFMELTEEERELVNAYFELIQNEE